MPNWLRVGEKGVKIIIVIICATLLIWALLLAAQDCEVERMRPCDRAADQRTIL